MFCFGLFRFVHYDISTIDVFFFLFRFVNYDIVLLTFCVVSYAATFVLLTFYFVRYDRMEVYSLQKYDIINIRYTIFFIL